MNEAKPAGPPVLPALGHQLLSALAYLPRVAVAMRSDELHPPLPLVEADLRRGEVSQFVGIPHDVERLDEALFDFERKSRTNNIVE